MTRLNLLANLFRRAFGGALVVIVAIIFSPEWVWITIGLVIAMLAIGLVLDPMSAKAALRKPGFESTFLEREFIAGDVGISLRRSDGAVTDRPYGAFTSISRTPWHLVLWEGPVPWLIPVEAIAREEANEIENRVRTARRLGRPT